jgi:hypothetical protein
MSETRLEKKRENIGKIAYTLDKAYLSLLNEDYDVVDFETFNQKPDISYQTNIRALKINRVVLNKEERTSDCIKNILNVFQGSDTSIALLLERTVGEAKLWFVIRSMNNDGLNSGELAAHAIRLLESAVKGNFEGSKIAVIDGKETADCFDFERVGSIALTTGIPSDKSEKFISQSIDKLINGIVPKDKSEEYLAVFLAEPIKDIDVHNILSGFEQMATAITPYTEYSYQKGVSSTYTTGVMNSISDSKTIGKAISNTHSINVGVGGSGVHAGYGYAYSQSENNSETKTVQSSNTTGDSKTDSDSFTYNCRFYDIKGLLENIETQIKRIKKSRSDGLWKSSVYVCAKEKKQSESIASYIRALNQGDESYIEPSVVKEWSGTKDKDPHEPFLQIREYIKHFTHPVFKKKTDKDNLVTATTNISTSELALQFSFPRFSIPSVPLIECVRFGREPHSLDRLSLDLELGFAYHMHIEDGNKRIKISSEELTKHTFITGSTGSGKSNTIYKLLSEVCLKEESDTKFLVIEPAKGEYKEVFGGYEKIDGHKEVTVYGTNPYKVPKLLQINPFSFPKGIHVLEHIDRLVEVFNACWPMYAAMPAILKEAIEKAYESVGWYLPESTSKGEFPSFSTVLDELPKAVDNSGYWADTSANYKGALNARVHSLTNGINKVIFGDDIDPEELFNRNAIVDLSLVPSSDSKALIMGILVMKLQEFRTSEPKQPNSKLRHITVLEEAHNLLRRTSDVQTQESSNLQGKSVEMLANTIAEMRTYGEGFIIADQSPGLLDMSVIRNTNTKIILRLPDESDRQLVGKAAGLNDNQIIELARIKTGVAAIIQSGWLEPVLCMVDEFKYKKPIEIPSDGYEWHDPEKIAVKEFLNFAFNVERTELSAETVNRISKWAKKINTGYEDTTKNVRQTIDAILSGKSISKDQIFVHLIMGVLKKEIIATSITSEDCERFNNIIVSEFGFNESQDEIFRILDELFTKHLTPNTSPEQSRNTEKTEGCIQ